MSLSSRSTSVGPEVRLALSYALDKVRVKPGMLSEHVYRVLRDAILEGRLVEHAHLSQNPLADVLGVSRTPVRDALLRLAQEGLIYSVGGRGYLVAPLELTQVAEIYETRERLEQWALELVHGRITPTDLWEAKRLHQEMSYPETLDPGSYFELNSAFHRAFIRSGSNRTLLSLIDRLWELTTSRRMFVGYIRERENVTKMIAEHAKIFEAAESGDHDRLTAVVIAHIRAAEEDTTAFLARTGQKADRPDGRESAPTDASEA